MLYIYAAFISVIFFGLGSILIKYIIPEVNGSIQFLSLQLPLSFLLILPIFLIFESWNSSSYWGNVLEYLPLIFAASMLSFIGFLLMNVGLEHGNASVGSVILSSRVFFSVPLAILIVGETYPPLTYVFILIALIGAITVSWREELSLKAMLLFQAKGIRWFFGTALFWAIANLIVRQIGDSVSVLTFIFIRGTILLFASFITYRIYRRYRGIKPISYQRKTAGKLALYLVSNLAAQFMFIFALGVSLTITEAIGTGEGVVTLIGSIILAKYVDNKILDEPTTGSSITIRIVGAIFAITGTLGVVLVSQ